MGENQSVRILRLKQQLWEKGQEIQRLQRKLKGKQDVIADLLDFMESHGSGVYKKVEQYRTPKWIPKSIDKTNSVVYGGATEANQRRTVSEAISTCILSLLPV